jgi:hypothetical protein
MIHVTLLTSAYEGRPARAMRAGRVCAREDCGTVLSVYNRQPFCGVHADDDDNVVPEGCCRCTKCGQVLEWTSEFFHRSPNGGPAKLHRSCKECRNSRGAHDRDKAARERVPPGSKHCPRCGKDKRLNLQWWYQNNSGAECGRWSSWCKQCITDRNHDAARDARQAKLDEASP